MKRHEPCSHLRPSYDRLELAQSDIVERLQRKVFRGPTMEAVHTKTLEWEAADTITRLTAEVERLRAGLCVCELELNAYYRMEYPGSHPYSQKELAKVMSSNPATVALKENNNDQG